MAKRTIDTKEVVKDVKKVKLSDREIMDKYKLDYKELVFIFGKLGEINQLPVGKAVNVVKNCLAENDIENANGCFNVIEKYFPKIQGIKSLHKRVRHAVERKECQEDYQKQMENESPSLKQFRIDHPGVLLHSEIERMVKITDLYADKLYEEVSKRRKDLVDITRRLSIVAKNNHLFSDLSNKEATRMWHYLMLVNLAESGIKYYFVKSVSDPMTCWICKHIDYASFPVQKVRDDIIERVNSNRFMPEKSFPFVEEIDNISPEEKMRVLTDNGWYLPPFCRDCRCQIIP